MKQKVLVMGASKNPSRYAFIAANMLDEYGHELIMYGKRDGEVAGVKIQTELPKEEVDTVTLYLGPKNQVDYYDYLLDLKPKRVIFNPGTENPVLYEMLRSAGVGVEIACTLVLLRTEQFAL